MSVSYQAVGWNRTKKVYDALLASGLAVYLGIFIGVGFLVHPNATAETLLTIARDPKRLGVELGFLAVLHTWGQNLHFHPHLHCVVPGGGLSMDHDRWVGGRRRFLLPVKVLSRFFCRVFLDALEKAHAAGQLQFFGALESLRDPHAFARYLAPLHQSEWVVYAKAPFGGPQHVLEYLGRYTHRVAISNRRLLALENGQVSFQWKDYRDGQQKVMTAAAEEFIRRLLQHALPTGLHASAITAFWPTVIAPPNSTCVVVCWPRRARTCCPISTSAASFWRRSSPETPGSVRSAASESWRPFRFCGRAMARFRSAWIAHEDHPPEV